MNNRAQIKIGLKSYPKAFNFIFKHKMGWTFLVPVLLGILLFIGAQTAVIQFIHLATDWTQGWISMEDHNFWASIIQGALGFLIELLFFLLFAYIGGYLVLIFMSPVLAYVSEKTEKIYTGNEYVFQLKQFFKDIFRSIFLSLRNIIIELIFIVLTFFIGFIPVIGWLAPVFLFFISSYFYGFSFIDFSNERRKLNIKQSVSLGRQNKGIAISNGAVYAIPLFIPIAGAYIVLFVSLISTVAATIAMIDSSAYQRFNE